MANIKNTIQSVIENPTARESELLACLEFTLKKLAQAQDYIKFLGGCNESIEEIQTALDVNVYLSQYDINVPVFVYEGKELEPHEEEAITV